MRFGVPAGETPAQLRRPPSRRPELHRQLGYRGTARFRPADRLRKLRRTGTASKPWRRPKPQPWPPPGKRFNSGHGEGRFPEDRLGVAQLVAARGEVHDAGEKPAPARLSSRAGWLPTRPTTTNSGSRRPIASTRRPTLVVGPQAPRLEGVADGCGEEILERAWPVARRTSLGSSPALSGRSRYDRPETGWWWIAAWIGAAGRTRRRRLPSSAPRGRGEITAQFAGRSAGSRSRRCR
jgi:hypothetical protein